MSDPDRPLSDAQERALITIADHAPGWTSNSSRSVTTLDALKRRGLIEYRFSTPWSRYEARITPAGVAMVNSMGD
jgi:hypothetical protein